jgi:outer membrane protein OmpU
MKTLLLSTVAAGVVFAAAPAFAQIDLTVGGHTKNYMGYMTQDDDTGTDEERNFDMLRESEIHINAEGTADNGLTYGFHVEMNADGGDGAVTADESYMYLSSNLGRVNLGSEDGANYLLQVAAPSADSNIDGIRQYIQPVNYEVTTLGAAFDGTLDYANDDTGIDEKVTYLSPIWNGFQFGLSYTPDVASNGAEDINSASGLNGFAGDEVEDNLSSAYEGAVRYEGNFNNIGFALGAGYTQIDIEEDTNNSSDDVQQWNVGADFDIGAFGVGAAYTETNNVGGADDTDTETYVVGVDYTTGPFQIGGSYFNKDDEANTVDTDRYTGGVVYTAAPGLSFRGSISHIEHDVTGGDIDATSVLGGVQMNF